MELRLAIVFVSDMKRSVTFYRDTVGLPLRFESTHWTEFETGEATLALHLAEVAGESDRSKATPEPPGSCRPGFRVADIAGFHRRMTEKRVPCLQEPKLTFGVQIAQYADPDGLPFSVSEDPRESGAGGE
jgi:lactoylglutathione lyase